MTSTGGAAPPAGGRPDPLTRELLGARAALRRAWDAVPVGDRTRAPAPGSWSPAEVLSHLAVTQDQVVRLARRLWADRTEPLPPRPAEVRLEEVLDGLGVTDRTRRQEAPAFARPDAGATPLESWRRLERGLEALATLAARCHHRDVSGLVQDHPVLGPLDLHQWILFAAQHERRHAGQLG